MLLHDPHSHPDSPPDRWRARSWLTAEPCAKASRCTLETAEAAVRDGFSSSNHPYSARGRGLPVLALFVGLGVLPLGRAGAGAVDRLDPCAFGADIGLTLRFIQPEICRNLFRTGSGRKYNPA